MPNTFNVERVNLHTFSASELNNLIYDLFGIKPESQLLFYTTENINDYEHRILVIKKSTPKKLMKFLDFITKTL